MEKLELQTELVKKKYTLYFKVANHFRIKDLIYLLKSSI